jgi:hypothetical protein
VSELKDSGATGYLCASKLAPLSDPRSVLRCPLDGSVYDKAVAAGQICETCHLTRLGQDAIGLTNFIEEAE